MPLERRGVPFGDAVNKPVQKPASMAVEPFWKNSAQEVPSQPAPSYGQQMPPQAAPPPPAQPAQTEWNPHVDPPRVPGEFREATEFAATGTVRGNYNPFQEDISTLPVKDRLSPQSKVLAGLQTGTSPAEIARQLQTDFQQAEQRARSLPPGQVWDGYAKLENDTQEALNGLRNQTVVEHLLEWHKHTGMTAEQIISAYSGEGPPLPLMQQQALEKSLSGILKDPVFQFQAERHYAGKIMAGNVGIAPHTMRKNSQGRMEVYLTLNDGSIDRLEVPPVTPQEVEAAKNETRIRLDTSHTALMQAQKALAAVEAMKDKPLAGQSVRGHVGEMDRREKAVIAAKNKLATAEAAHSSNEDRMKHLLIQGKRVLLNERVTAEVAKPEWRGKVGSYDGLGEVAKGRLQAMQGIGSLYASVTGDEELQKKLAQDAEDLDHLIAGSTRRHIEGGWWNDTVITAQRALGEELLLLPVTAATGGGSSIVRAGGKQVAKNIGTQAARRSALRRTAAEGVMQAAQGYGSSVLDTNQRYQHALDMGDTETARRLKEGRELRGVVSGLLGQVASKVNPFKGRGSTVGNNVVQDGGASTIEGGLIEPLFTGQNGFIPGDTTSGTAGNLIASGLMGLPGLSRRRPGGSPVSGPQPDSAPPASGPQPATPPLPAEGTSQTDVNPLADADRPPPDPAAQPPAAGTPPVAQAEPILKDQKSLHGEDVTLLERNPDGTFQVKVDDKEKTFTEAQVAAMIQKKKGPLYDMLREATQRQQANPPPPGPPIWSGEARHGDPVKILSRNPDGTFQVVIGGQEVTRTERDIAYMTDLRKGPLHKMLREATQRKLAERAAAASAGSAAGSAGSAAGTDAASAAVSVATPVDGTPGSVPQTDGGVQTHQNTSVNNSGAAGGSQPLAATHGDPRILSRAIARATADINRQLPGQVGTDTHLFQSAEEFLQSDYARNRQRPFTEAEAAAILEADGFHDPLTGQSIVIAGNVRPQAGESPHQALARVAMHESIGHGGVNRLLARSPQEKVRFDRLVQRIPDDYLAAIAADPAYAHLKDDRRALALEWLARKTEEQPDLLGNPRSHLAKMWDTLRQAVANLQTRLGLKADQGRDLDALVGDMITRARTAALRRGPNPSPAGGDSALQFSQRSNSGSTRTGAKRTNPADWRKTRDLWDSVGYSELLSHENRMRINMGTPPRVDDEWIAQHPEDEGLRGQQIRMHHVLGLPITTPLPISRHLDAHMPGGFRFNHGGIGSQLPLY